MSKPAKPRLVVVEWVDAVAVGSWCNATHRQEPIKAKSCGWVLHSDKNYIQLAGTLAVDGEWNQSMTIPKGMVISVKNA
jgi:hypothetical protein